MTGYSTDRGKDLLNIDKHGAPLLIATAVFEGPFVEREDHRHDYGERASSPSARSPG